MKQYCDALLAHPSSLRNLHEKLAGNRITNTSITVAIVASILGNTREMLLRQMLKIPGTPEPHVEHSGGNAAPKDGAVTFA